ncbi:hypothetical protein Hdeb2414_s0003g00102431 [Helianthus debilis subsp. tardiflorus]
MKINNVIMCVDVSNRWMQTVVGSDSLTRKAESIVTGSCHRIHTSERREKREIDRKG